MGGADAPRAGLPLPHRGLRHRRRGPVPPGTATCPQGLRRPDALDRRSRPPRGDDRGRGIRTVTGRILGDESFYDRKRGAAGLEALLRRRRDAAALGPRRRPRPRLAGALAAAPRGADVPRGARPPRRHGRRAGPASASRPRRRSSLASDVSDPLAAIVRHMNHESDNFYAEMLLKQLPAAAGKVGTSAGGGRLVDRDDARGRDPGRRRPHRRRLRALEPRPPHGRRARRRDPGRRHGPDDQGRVRRLAGRRRHERDAQPAACRRSAGR